MTGVLLAMSSEDDGGLATVVRMLAEALPAHGLSPVVALQRRGRVHAALSAAGIPVHVVPELLETLDRGPDGRASIAAIPGNLRALPLAVNALRELARRHDATVLYGHGSWPNYLVAEATRSPGGHALAAVWHIHTPFSPANAIGARLIRSRARVHAVIGVSQAVAAGYAKLGLPVQVVHNGVSLDACERAARSPELRDRLGIPRDAFVAGYCGRLVTHKGIAVLLQAAQRILTTLPQAHVVVLGGTPSSSRTDVIDDLRRRFALLGAPERVHLPGYVGAPLPWLAGFDVALVPSLYPDPCPLTVLEALGCGVPVVASRIGGIPELVDDGTDGRLVPAGDSAALAGAIIALARDPTRRRRMAEAAREAARRRFDFTVTAARVAAILRASAQDVATVAASE